MPNNQQTKKSPFTETAIAIIEEEARRPIENISLDELSIRVKTLTVTDFYFKGSKCKQSALHTIKRNFFRLIAEKKFFDYVKRMKNQEIRKKSQEFQPPIITERRIPYETLSGILTTSEDGLKKTHIMYKNELPHKALNKYLDILLRLGLLEYDEKERIYKTTDLGLDYSYSFQQLKKSLSGEYTKPIILNENLRSMAIFALHELKGRRQVYDLCALILEKASKPTTKNSLRKTSTRSENIDRYIDFLTKSNFLEYVEKTDLFKTTQRGSQYLKTYLNFILFNYLG